jgi:hypothetical protein
MTADFPIADENAVISAASDDLISNESQATPVLAHLVS